MCKNSEAQKLVLYIIESYNIIYGSTISWQALTITKVLDLLSCSYSQWSDHLLSDINTLSAVPVQTEEIFSQNQQIWQNSFITSS